MLSNFAFSFKLRRYDTADSMTKLRLLHYPAATPTGADGRTCQKLHV